MLCCRNYTKLRASVTSIYVLNLLVTDFIFLVSQSFHIDETIRDRWIFGAAFCKIHFAMYCVKWFTSPCVLTVMSVDRYLAVCKPAQSRRYRTTTVACIVCAAIWVASVLSLLPIWLYATYVVGLHGRIHNGQNCDCTLKAKNQIPAVETFYTV